jgi:hypothetical protein
MGWRRYDGFDNDRTSTRFIRSAVGFSVSEAARITKHGIEYYGVCDMDPRRYPHDVGPLDEPSPPCKACGVPAVCEDGICGACGENNRDRRGRKMKNKSGPRHNYYRGER